MQKLHLSLLRGVCQIPAYAACLKGFFAREDVEATFVITPTAWLVPQQLVQGDCDFAVLPWTRVAVAEEGEAPLRVVCGSGYEEAALVVQHALRSDQVKSIAVPREGGMKDLTAMGLIDTMGWSKATQLRFPSGDGAIIAFFGQGADAASMVEPYATMFEQMGTGRVVKRTGDVWPGAPRLLTGVHGFAHSARSRSRAARRARLHTRSCLCERAPGRSGRTGGSVDRYQGRVHSCGHPRESTECGRCSPCRNDAHHSWIHAVVGLCEGNPEGFVDLRFMDSAANDASV
jgi:hypothetical protein